ALVYSTRGLPETCWIARARAQPWTTAVSPMALAPLSDLARHGELGSLTFVGASTKYRVGSGEVFRGRPGRRREGTSERPTTLVWPRPRDRPAPACRSRTRCHHPPPPAAR